MAAVAVSFAAVAAVAPVTSNASPSQEGPEGGGDDEALVAIDVDVADGDAAAITGALDEMQANVGAQLKQLTDAENGVKAALDKLSAADSAIIDTQWKIDELTGQSDSVVVSRFMNPPSEGALESLSAESVSDATIKQALLEMRADEDAAELAELTAARKELAELQDEQEKNRADAEQKKTSAEAALADVQKASDQQTQFIIDVRAWLADPNGALKMAAASPEDKARIDSMTADLNAKIGEIEAAEQAKEAEEARLAALQRTLKGGFVCPVDGPMNFSDTWGAARSGGRSHKGTDMMAATGTPVVAPANGRLVHRSNSLGGLSFHLYSDDGHEYYGAHLSAYENQGVGWVQAGTLIGRVGHSGNASASGPHLHFEYHPNQGAAVNPYARLNEVCEH
jgi:murein DD-endopeptidase MepM/ murein hydrolase activator NlpD